MIRKERSPFIAFAGVALIIGLIAGLQRIGWSFPLGSVSSHHGAIMIGGFLGTLIALEKVIPLKKPLLLLVPGLSAFSVVNFFFGPPIISWVLLIVASNCLVIVFVAYWLREKSIVYGLMATGALSWLVGNVIFILDGFYPASIPWWMAFALLIIAAERLELMKFLPVTTSQKRWFITILFLFVLSCALSFHGFGNWVASVSLIVIAVWLMRFDVVALNVRKENLTRFSGIALLSGYCALLLVGVFLLVLMKHPLGYDVIVHSFFIGFVFSMIFAHGPIILPGVLGISLKPYHQVFYIWLLLLHASWVIRTIAGLLVDISLRKNAGLLSALAIVGYFVSLVIVSIRSRAKAV